MGVKNLWDILESCKKTLPLHHLQNKRVCIDLSCWMVQLQNASKSHFCMKEKVYLKGLFHRIRALIALNCSLIFVTDGSIPAIKLATYRRRLNSGSEQVTHNESNLQKLTSLRRNMGSEFSCMVKEAKVLGMALGIPCLDGIEEAEAQCALLNSESLCDGCFTSDSDIFLFGARTVYRDICLGDGGNVICYEMADVERQLGYGRNSLITLALMLGSDYSQGVYGLGPESACQIVKSVGDKVVLQKIASEGLSFVLKKKGSKKQGTLSKCNNKENSLDQEMNVNGSEYNLLRDDQLLQVINAYLKPKCHSADSDAVHRTLAQYPFQRAKLQQICSQFFEWPAEKTDEYILPKIAERNLRRFCNLRSTSSNLGLKLPLHKLPVKCPLSGVIKHRKVQGRDCYEVSWEEVDGLKTSVVPADLVESACPEKIVEFEEKRAHGNQEKLRKPRPKKSEKGSSLAEIDLKLQKLLHDIDMGSSAAVHDASSMVVISGNQTAATKVNQENQHPWLDPMSSAKCSDDIPWSQVGPSTTKSEVIDLLSPSPLRQPRAVSKFTQSNGQGIDVIDLSESETDVSPEHEKKARELRLFLASIKDDMF
ncbi:single-strand DNA endonuclease 1 isoform X1 [Juglans regia]|uniref:Single-strand DNA endonuclease 1 n=1 Tax=Juglans regia TaxID=51240 RepID=A0A6P9F4P0_JUGRE|nr:single-strand DNA endonuclease 1 isoform X1 [Juglans regia]